MGKDRKAHLGPSRCSLIEVFNEETLKALKIVAKTARKHGKMAETVGNAANFKVLKILDAVSVLKSFKYI